MMDAGKVVVQADVAKDEALDWFRKMALIRRFEEQAEEAYGRGLVGGFLHLYIGEEAIAVGAMAALAPEDDVFTHYRDHGYLLARGIDPKPVMAELFGRSTGVSKGKGGSMHMADVANHLWGGYAIVGGHVPLAAGMAFANRYLGRNGVVACFLGEGGTNIGTFYAGLNLAAVWKVPLVVIVENNHYAMGSPVDRVSAVRDIYRKACAFDMPGVQVDGNDVAAVRDAVRERVEAARGGGGPQLVEAVTYRFRGHSMGDPQRYRTKEEVEKAKAGDPILRWRQAILDGGLAAESELRKVEARVEADVDDAVRFATSSPAPDEVEIDRDVLVGE
ncbi:MAG TPA: pyruvate dehydrogenase (acetyl-transferring) E1 component subunit alpha [Candidatus Deferrimicrobiaceae bacterium]